MNIEMGESLVASWLKHVKGCQIVQTNWRPPWCLKEADYKYAKSLIETLESDIGEKVFPRCKCKGGKGIQGSGEAIDVRQILGMTECDAVGLAFVSGENAPRFYAVESAFHSDGLHYKSTVKKVIAKMVKAILSLHFHMGARNIETSFMTPVVKESVLNDIEKAIGTLRSFFDRTEWKERFNCEISFYTRTDQRSEHHIGIKSFYGEVIRPLIMRVPLADDDCELFMRSMLMWELCQGHRLPVRSSLRSALLSLNCTVGDIEKLPEDLSDRLKDANEKHAIKGCREWIAGSSLSKDDFTDSARRVSGPDEVKRKQ